MLRVLPHNLKMRVVRMFAVFAAIIFVSAVIIFKTHGEEDELYVVLLSQEEVNCTSFLDMISPPFPALLIDHRILRLLKRNICRASKAKVRIAVDVRYSAIIRKAKYPMYDIVYYERPADTDYLRFLDDVTRIIPRQVHLEI
ncbi:hypothetical protein OESDEN_10198 [Oesophagostomum dentatum]|uniref:W02B3.4-like N-terminal domain-containing protein n=1 Tax=Oesophagostomum dentatum TaxID=61180 RepID=A0A0B1T1D6_OESDE|nr:hypothetical protein OESDEN_10198 [Oesophagostomum dentatum]